jgi:AcrR family transcriptional regulator
MTSGAAPRSRRERPAKPALSREAIVAAALQIAREEGVEALSMRRVAQALDTGPASLYVYVADRDELHELLFDAAVGTVETEPVDPDRWREQLTALVRRMVKVMADDFPGLALLAMAHIPTGDNALRVTESLLALLKAGGASDQAAAYAADLVSLYATAIAYEQSLYRALYSDPEHEQREVEKLAERFASLDAKRYPTMVALGPAMTLGDGDERFELGLDVIINGLLATPTEGRLTRRPLTAENAASAKPGPAGSGRRSAR